MRYVGVSDPFYVIGERLHAGRQAQLDDRAARVIRVEVVSQIERPRGLGVLDRYTDDSGLTRLDELLVKEVYGRASTGCGARRSKPYRKEPHCGRGGPSYSQYLRLRELERRIAGVTHCEDVHKLLAGKRLPEIMSRALDGGFGPCRLTRPGERWGRVNNYHRRKESGQIYSRKCFGLVHNQRLRILNAGRRCFKQ